MNSVMTNSLSMPMQRIELHRISLICIALYLGSAAIAIFLSRQPGSIATLWYSNAVIVVACMHRGQRDSYILLLLGTLSNLFINRYFGSSWTLSFMFMAVNGLEMFFSVSLLARFCHLERSIASPKELTKTLVAGGLIPTFLCGILAAYLLLRYGVVSSFSTTFFSWFEGSLIGMISVLPIGMLVGIIGWKNYFDALWRPHILAALLLILTLTPIAASSLSFPYAYIISLMILLAFKGGFAGASLGVFLCSIEVSVLIASGLFPAPPRINFYYEALFYIPLLLTLTLPLLIASGLEQVSEANLNLMLERERFRRLYEDTPAMMASVTMQGQVVHASKLLLQHLDYAQEEVCGRDVAEFFLPESRTRGMTEILPAFLIDGVVSDVHLQLYRRNGDVIDVAMSAVWEYHNGDSSKRGLVVLRDVTEERRLATKMAYLAQHDSLTGLPNRVLFQDRVTHLCALSKREKKCFALMFLDLDHFKEVNDTLGHGIGDALLQLVAARLRKTMRGADTISRIGGDEFVILIGALGTPHDASEVAEKILHEVAGPAVIDGQTLTISLSLGIALFSQDGSDHNSLLKNADSAMYQAKRSGRNRYCFFQNVPSNIEQSDIEPSVDSRKNLKV